ncbi:MAG: asparagine synthase (glutamine-hydrolyzing) [Bacteroidetes bacterium]|nr:asparagine synthase (glutamine-hydrolyzing) [Bacteroidota bacterium]MBU1720514.1 asparagine synthase (glutamine-hydrolyzing) [Bacteroidota bacterium]
MCGIIGYWGESPIEKRIFNAMRDTMVHRGPDGEGSTFLEHDTVALGHRRLAFMDLSEKGKQPFVNENGSVFLTCNGEIYNYRSLRHELEQKGHTFISGSDNEVILHGYEEWGTAVLQRLHGMFAFGIYDNHKKQLFLARDRFGIKPLYVGEAKNSFLFASEIKGILKYPGFNPEFNWAALARFLQYRFVPSPGSAWKNVLKIPPAHFLLYRLNGDVEFEKYWELPEYEDCNVGFNQKDFEEEVKSRLEESVKSHLMADVPVGLFLSGGYDSSTLALMMAKVQPETEAFTIGFEGWEKSEHHAAQSVAKSLGIKCNELMIRDEGVDLLESLMYHYDEPIADISIIPTRQVSRFAAGKVKAVLSGEGSDEIFAGYDWYKPDFFKPIGIRGYLKRQKTDFSVNAYSYAMSNGKFNIGSLTQLFEPEYHRFIYKAENLFYDDNFKSSLPPIKRFQQLDIKSFMGELVLTKVDRASMASSLEVRVPFLDHTFIEFMFRKPVQAYFSKDKHKPLLRKILHGNIPDAVLNRKKQGFVGPDSFYGQMDWYRRVFADSALLKDKIIRREAIDAMINNNEQWRLWKLAVLEKWYSFWKGECVKPIA